MSLLSSLCYVCVPAVMSGVFYHWRILLKAHSMVMSDWNLSSVLACGLTMQMGSDHMASVASTRATTPSI